MSITKMMTELAALDDMIEILSERCQNDRITDALLREMQDTTESMKNLLGVVA